MLLQNFTSPFSLLRVRHRRDPNTIVHLVEVTFTSDLALNPAMVKKAEQHQQLRANLMASGWVRIKLHCFVIGHTGTMLTTNAGILAELGISSRRIPTLRSFLSQQVLCIYTSERLLESDPFGAQTQHMVSA